MTNLDKSSGAIASAGICAEDMLRADMYDFLAALMRSEPSDALISKKAIDKFIKIVVRVKKKLGRAWCHFL